MALEDLAVYEALAKEILRRTVSEEDPIELHRWLSDQVARVGGKTDDNVVLTWFESFNYYETLLEKRARDAALPEEERKTLNWPWTTWNKHIDPLEPGMLAVITAPDGQGKTIVAESIAEHWARHRNRVAFVHYELNWALMMDRRAVRHTQISRRELASGTLTPEQRRLITEMRPRLLAWDGYISYLHTPGWNIDQTILKLRQMVADQECDVVIIDYLEKISASRRQLQLYGANIYQREADNVEELKNFAESSGIPVLMVAQMSKAGKQQKTTEMDRTDMRGAAEKSDRANLVILLARKPTDTGYSTIVDVTVDKQTLGPQIKFKQMMIPELFRMADIQDTIEEPSSRHKD